MILSSPGSCPLVTSNQNAETHLRFTSELVGNRSLILCDADSLAYLHGICFLNSLTGVKSLVTVLLALMESVVLLLLLNLRLGNVPLVSGLIELGVADAGVSAHFKDLWTLLLEEIVLFVVEKERETT